jgi:hypothetical protein
VTDRLSLQTAFQHFDALQQVEYQCGTGGIHAQVALQSQGNPRAPQVNAIESPLRYGRSRDDALLHQFDYLPFFDGADAANLGDAEIALIFQDLAG